MCCLDYNQKIIRRIHRRIKLYALISIRSIVMLSQFTILLLFNKFCMWAYKNIFIKYFKTVFIVNFDCSCIWKKDHSTPFVFIHDYACGNNPQLRILYEVRQKIWIHFPGTWLSILYMRFHQNVCVYSLFKIQDRTRSIYIYEICTNIFSWGYFLIECITIDSIIV